MNSLREPESLLQRSNYFLWLIKPKEMCFVDVMLIDPITLSAFSLAVIILA
ncbi:MAG: hypothetical protein AAF830_15415 [Pseudomonadota bacterium]